VKPSERKRYLVGFDTEDDGAGNPFLWCFVHRNGSNVARSQHEALEVLLDYQRVWKSRGYQVEVWATNLEYDMCNLFDRSRISEVTFYFGRSYLCSARWRGVDFRDTTRHLPASVAELGKLVGAPKVEGELFDSRHRPDPVRDFERYKARCLRDAAITYRTVRMLGDAYRSLKTRTRTTLASTALAVWRDHYWRRAIVRPHPRVWSAAHEAYHGGRSQAFAVGTFEDVSVVDVASMFPWAMTCGSLPLPWGLVSHVRSGAELLPFGLYRVTVDSKLGRPCLPVRTARGTIYPNGQWSGWYVGEELLAFLERGGRLRVHEGYVFHETCEPFGGYVSALFKRKQRARGLKRTLYKLLLNALYGKFGQQGRRVRCVPLKRFLSLKITPPFSREWNGLVIFTEETAPPPWGNDVWPAFVTARARVRLAREIEQLEQRGARPLYCDTDSIMFTGGRHRYPARAAQLGGFELRGRYRRLLLVGKKEYALELRPGRWESRAKGVPLLERYRYLTTGTAEFDRPFRLREAAAGSGTVNVWRRVKKSRHVDLFKSALRSDGTLPVPWIIQGTETVRRGR